jgi:hypothetical protein
MNEWSRSILFNVLSGKHGLYLDGDPNRPNDTNVNFLTTEFGYFYWNIFQIIHVSDPEL